MPCLEQLSGQCVKYYAFDLVYISQLDIDIITQPSQKSQCTTYRSSIVCCAVVSLLLNGEASPVSQEVASFKTLLSL